MITALPLPSVKVFHKTYYQEKRSRIGSSQPGSPLAESEAVLALVDKEPPEYYFCGKVNSLHVVVGSLLLGAIVLVVGLVQLAPGAEAAQNSAVLIAAGCGLLVLGVFLVALRALCIRRQKAAQKDGTHQRSVTSIDMLLAQHRQSTQSHPERDMSPFAFLETLPNDDMSSSGAKRVKRSPKRRFFSTSRDFTVLTPDELEDLVGRPASALENKIRKQGHNT